MAETDPHDFEHEPVERPRSIWDSDWLPSYSVPSKDNDEPFRVLPKVNLNEEEPHPKTDWS